MNTNPIEPTGRSHGQMLTVAKDEWGNQIHIADLASMREIGESIECFCLACDRQLAPRIGKVKRHHFAHMPDSRDRDCWATTGEGEVHLAAKAHLANLLRDLQAESGALRCTVKCPACQSPLVFELMRLEADHQVEVERWGDPRHTFRPDITIRRHLVQVAWLEVLVHHEMSGDKARYAKEQGIPTLELPAASVQSLNSLLIEPLPLASQVAGVHLPPCANCEDLSRKRSLAEREAARAKQRAEVQRARDAQWTEAADRVIGEWVDAQVLVTRRIASVLAVQFPNRPEANGRIVRFDLLAQHSGKGLIGLDLVLCVPLVIQYGSARPAALFGITDGTMQVVKKFHGREIPKAAEFSQWALAHLERHLDRENPNGEHALLGSIREQAPWPPTASAWRTLVGDGQVLVVPQRLAAQAIGEDVLAYQLRQRQLQLLPGSDWILLEQLAPECFMKAPPAWTPEYKVDPAELANRRSALIWDVRGARIFADRRRPLTPRGIEAALAARRRAAKAEYRSRRRRRRYW